QVMKTLYEHRHDSPGVWSAWGLFLVVRGLGCRPDEAIHLSWESVDFEHETVRFMDSKENRTKVRKPRTVPILFICVRDGLPEQREDYERREAKVMAHAEYHEPPVCLTRMNSYFESQQTATDTSIRAMN